MFGTLKDGSLEINSLALNNCFSYRNIFQNDVNALSKMVLKNLFYLSKSSKFHIVWTIRFCSTFTSMWCKHFSRNVWKDFGFSISALATVAGKSFNSKFTAKIDFPIRHFRFFFFFFFGKSPRVTQRSVLKKMLLKRAKTIGSNSSFTLF